MGVHDDAVGDHEAPRQLHAVAHGHADDVPFCSRHDPRLDHSRVVRDLAHRPAWKVVEPVRSALGIDEGFERDRPRLEESLEILRRPLADDDNASTLLDELVVMVAQLRDVPAAERSAVVTQEDEDHGLLGPKGCEVRRGAV